VPSNQLSTTLHEFYKISTNENSRIDEEEHKIPFNRFSHNLKFMTKRSFLSGLLTSFLKLTDISSLDSKENFEGKIEKSEILKRRKYIGKKSGPLFYTIFHGDLQTSLNLLYMKPEILFWYNEEGRFPLDMLEKRKDNPMKTKVVGLSILDQYLNNLEVLLESNGYSYTREAYSEENMIERKKKKISKKNSLRRFLSVKKTKTNEELKNTETKPDIKEEETKNKPKVKKEPKKEKKMVTLKLNFPMTPSQNILFHNSYILLNEELCLGFINERFSQRPKSVFNFPVSQLAHLHDLTKFKLRKLFIWAHKYYRNYESSPGFKTYIDEGMTLIHLLCKRGSSKTLNFYIEEQRHKIQKLETLGKFGIKDNSVFSHKLEEIKKQRDLVISELLSIPTREGKNTPAHICMMNYEDKECMKCFMVLSKFGIDLKFPNLKGISVYDLIQLVKVNGDIEFEQNFNNLKSEMERKKLFYLSTCKKHSIKAENGLSEAQFNALFNSADPNENGHYQQSIKDEIVMEVRNDRQQYQKKL
jgi:hypothetical protein